VLELKVCIIYPAYPHCGSRGNGDALYLRKLAESLAAYGCNVYIVTSKDESIL